MISLKRKKKITNNIDYLFYLYNRKYNYEPASISIKDICIHILVAVTMLLNIIILVQSIQCKNQTE